MDEQTEAQSSVTYQKQFVNRDGIWPKKSGSALIFCSLSPERITILSSVV